MNARETISRLRGKAHSVYSQTLQRAYFSLLGHQVDQQFAIVANARTGSNYLLDGLKSSPMIRMYHEIFASHNRQLGKDYEKILSTVFQHESRSTQVVGFKVFYNHLTQEEWSKLVVWRDLKVIHLTRRNRLRTVISLEIAFKTGRWTKSGSVDSLQKRRIQLEPAKLFGRLEQIEQGEMVTRLRFRDRPMLELVYEDMIRSPHETFASVSNYLGVDGMNPDKIPLKRQNPESLEQLIINYAEIEAVLKNTRFAEYLDG
jgi:LPS sulfotransferase NodH